MLWWWPTCPQDSLREKVKETGDLSLLGRAWKSCRASQNHLTPLMENTMCAQHFWVKTSLRVSAYATGCINSNTPFSTLIWILLNAKTCKDRWLIITDSQLLWRLTAKAIKALRPCVSYVLNSELKKRFLGSQIYTKGMHRLMSAAWVPMLCFSFGRLIFCLCRSNLAGNVWALQSQEVMVTQEFCF